MALDFEEEVVLCLVGYHVGGPFVSVGFPSFIFPCDATEANRCGALADVLKVSAGCFRHEGCSHGAGVRVKPFLHVDLELVFSVLVLEYIGHLACAPVIRGRGPVGLLWRGSWDSERVPK